MKNIELKLYSIVLFFCSTTMLFAQTPGDTGDGTGGLEGTDAVAAPIDNYVWVLTFIGILLVFMKFRAIQVRKII